MSNLPIQFQDKENSPALLAYLQQFGEKSYLSAEEINQIRDAINELAQGSLPDAVFAHTHPISDVTGLPMALDYLQLNKEDKANKNIANGYAGLDSSGRVNPEQLPQKTVSLTVPSGVPNDGDEWILYTL